MDASEGCHGLTLRAVALTCSRTAVPKKFPIAPKNPHRICWGCDRYCPANSLACGNGSERTQHPVELFGDDWYLWEIGPPASADSPSGPTSRAGMGERL